MFIRKDILQNRTYYEFNFGLFYGTITSDELWICLKFLDWGFIIKKTPLMFSERMGISKYIPLGFGWRLGKLTK